MANSLEAMVNTNDFTREYTLASLDSVRAGRAQGFPVIIIGFVKTTEQLACGRLRVS